MATTFLKRQKEMKRLEKARMKAERRAQKKLANANRPEGEQSDGIEALNESGSAVEGAPEGSESQN